MSESDQYRVLRTATDFMVNYFRTLPTTSHALIGQRVHHKCSFPDCPLFGVVKNSWFAPAPSNRGVMEQWYFEVDWEGYDTPKGYVPPFGGITGLYALEAVA